MADDQLHVLSENETNILLDDIVDAYNDVSNCDQDGAFRRIDQAVLVRVNEDSHYSSEVEWIVRITGVCDGCVESAQSLFSNPAGATKNDTMAPRATNSTGSQAGLNSTNETMVEREPCICPGPEISSFQEQLNQIQEANSTGANVMKVVELVNEESCDPQMTQDDDVPQQHSTLVMLVVSQDPSDMTDTDLQSLITSSRRFFMPI